tara:strand:- start:4494 stop:5690 length:1197 start_codon:yes stop_codon:yes gene_type:complete
LSIRKRTWATNGVEQSAWQCDYVDAQGKRRRKNFKLKKEAQAFLDGAKGEVRSGVHVPDGETVTVSKAGELWLKSCAAAGLEATTIAQYKQHLILHITPYLGDTKLNKITVPTVRSFQDDLRDNGRSEAMVRRVTVSLGSILSDAQDRGLSVRNAVQEMSRRRKGSTATQKRQKPRVKVGVDIPTTEEIRAIVEAAAGRWRPFLIVAIFTGLRASELRGLPWSDVDLDNALVHVRQRADAHNQIGPPKSAAGVRTIPLPPMAVNALREWKLACPKGELNLVFPTGAGGVEYHANIVKRGLHPTLIAAGVALNVKLPDGNFEAKAKYTGLHALRHWYASWLINRPADGGLGLTAKQVQERMGHSSVQMTLDVYSHLFPVVDEGAAMAQAEQAIFAARAT